MNERDLLMSISGNIRILRKKAGLTQIELADAMTISIATLRRWEAGETTPTGTKITELAKILGVAPEEIITSEPETKLKTPAAANNGTLVFEHGGTRIELPPTEEGYKIFRELMQNTKLIPGNKEGIDGKAVFSKKEYE